MARILLPPGERFDGVEVGRTPRRQQAKKEAARDSGYESRNDGPSRRHELELGKTLIEAIDTRHAQAEARAGPRHAKQYRLREKEPDDLSAPSADSLHQADLCRPLADRDQHDVHDEDARNNQADGSDAA